MQSKNVWTVLSKQSLQKVYWHVGIPNFNLGTNSPIGYISCLKVFYTEIQIDTKL